MTKKMRAKTVNENINFERSGNVKKTIRVGEHRVYKEQELIDAIESSIWEDLNTMYREYLNSDDEIILKDNLYNTVVAMVQNPDEEGIMALDHPDQFTIENYKEYLMDVFDIDLDEYRSVNENMKFERRQSPKDSLNIGHQNEIDLIKILNQALAIIKDPEYREYMDGDIEGTPMDIAKIGDITDLFYMNRRIIDKFPQISTNLNSPIMRWEGSDWVADESISELEYIIGDIIGDLHPDRDLMETANFKRGQSVKDSIGIGLNKKIESILTEYGLNQHDQDNIPIFNPIYIRTQLEMLLSRAAPHQLHNITVWQSVFKSLKAHPEVYGIDKTSKYWEALNWSVHVNKDMLYDLLTIIAKYKSNS